MCHMCLIRKAIYNVIPPACCRFLAARFCPQCFQRGIDEGAIVWIGNDAVGVCLDHSAEVA